MRTIKFRGKEIQNGIWVEGYYRQHKTSIGTFSHIVTENGIDYIVGPKTVGQFTGLTDKNGKEIYEGDIIAKHEHNAILIEWYGECLVYRLRWLLDGCTRLVDVDLVSMSVIVGNIHDNLDLLK